jgi:hypothetical protein
MDKLSKNSEKRKWVGAVGSTAWRAGLAALALLVLMVTVAALGFLVYRERITPEPFLLLVGIIVGFLLGRVDAAV